jgi:prepilin peptidase CpaA
LEWHTGITALWALILAGSDLRRRRLPNVLTLGALAFGLLWMLWSGITWLGGPWWTGLMGLAAAFFALLPSYAVKKLAAGDVKFMMAVGVLAGASPLLGIYLLAALFTLPVILLEYLLRGQVQRKTPFGFGIGVASALVLLSHWPPPVFPLGGH